MIFWLAASWLTGVLCGYVVAAYLVGRAYAKVIRAKLLSGALVPSPEEQERCLRAVTSRNKFNA